MLTFLTFMFVHLLADYPLQGDFLAKNKGRNLHALVSHAGIWTGMIVFAAVLAGYDIDLLDITLLFIVHALADYLKANKLLWYKNLDSFKGGLTVDQLIHVGQIVLLIYMNQ